VIPSHSSFAVDADALPASTPGAHGGLFASAGEGAQAFGELPGDSWLGLGVGDAGATLPSVVGSVQALASFASSLTGASAEAQRSSGLSASGLLTGLLLPIGALTSSSEAARTFHAWAGTAGLFASGNGLLELKGASVINSKSPTLSRVAVAQLGAALRRSGASVQAASIPGTDAAVSAKVAGLPVVLDIANGRAANGQTKFVIGLGEASVTAALAPSSALSSAASTATAASALGEGIQPSVTVDFPTLLTLLEGVGLSEDPTISALLPSLRSLTTLSGGGKPLGNGIERFRFVLGLRSGG
jgi:peptidoglycan hydrolase-like protein with peptidoglycan-binding domain